MLGALGGEALVFLCSLSFIKLNSTAPSLGKSEGVKVSGRAVAPGGSVCGATQGRFAPGENQLAQTAGWCCADQMTSCGGSTDLGDGRSTI